MKFSDTAENVQPTKPTVIKGTEFCFLVLFVLPSTE